MLSKTRTALLSKFDMTCSSLHSGAIFKAWTMSSRENLSSVLFSTAIIMFSISSLERKAQALRNLIIISYELPFFIPSIHSLTASLPTYLELAVSILMIRLMHCSGLMKRFLMITLLLLSTIDCLTCDIELDSSSLRVESFLLVSLTMILRLTCGCGC